MKMRNWFQLIILASLSIIWGCTSQDQVTLRIIGEALPPLEALNELKADYEKEFNIKISVEQYEFETAVEKVTLDLSSSSGIYDIVLQPHMSLGKFVESEFLEPIDKYLENPEFQSENFNPYEDLFPEFWKELSWYNNKCYGFPFTANTMYLWYRKDLLNNDNNKSEFFSKYKYELDIPKNWKQYYDVAEFFTNRENGFYGTALQGRRHPALWYEWLNFAYSFEGGVMKANAGWEYGPIIINSPQTIDATKYYKSLLRHSPPGALEYTWDDVLSDMQKGRIFMCIMWSDATYALEDPNLSDVVGKVGYDMIPEGKIGKTGQIAGWSYLISKFSKHKDEAYRFITWMLEPKNQIRQQNLGGASALKATYKDPDVKKIPYTEAYFNTVSVAKSMSQSVPEASQISDIIQKGLSSILSEEHSVEVGLNHMAAELEVLLNEKENIK